MNYIIAKGLLIPFLGTALGSALVFFMKKELNSRIQKILSGFAAGVMVAASVWSLLIPSMEMSSDRGRLAFIPAEATSGFLKMFNAGLKYCFGDFTLGTDLGWRFCDELHVNESTGALFAEFDPSEKLNLVAKAGYEKCYTTVPFMRELYSTDRRFFGGLAAHYFPLRDNDALRLHAVVAYDNGFPGLSINVGALYNIAIRIY